MPGVTQTRPEGLAACTPVVNVSYNHTFPLMSLSQRAHLCPQITSEGAHAQNSYSHEELAHGPLFLPGKVDTHTAWFVLGSETQSSQFPIPPPQSPCRQPASTLLLSSVVRWLNSFWELVPAGST